jgi:hypothetical protein
MKQRHHGILSDPVDLLPPHRVRELFDYDPLAGILCWRERPIRPGPDVSRDKGWNNRFAGKPAGCLTSFGYILVRVTPVLGTPLCVVAHRLAWAHYHGEWPVADLDHRNRIRNDNRIDNLRPATRAQNLANSRLRKDNTSGIRGITFIPRLQTWRASLNVNGRDVLGKTYATKEAAIQARSEAAQQFLGEFANEIAITGSGPEGPEAS